MKERPIIFSAPMVRAILEGQKTQTRRVIKPQPEIVRDPMPTGPVPGSLIRIKLGPGHHRFLGSENFTNEFCPYGQPGNRLWVRESFWPAFRRTENNAGVVYRANYLKPSFLDTTLYSREKIWTSPIYMPRWASRITLEIVAVHVERLQKIAVSDAIAEGIDSDGGDDEHRNRSTRENFAISWDALNAKRGFSWESNPWVWVIEFKRLEPDVLCAFASSRETSSIT